MSERSSESRFESKKGGGGVSKASFSFVELPLSTENLASGTPNHASKTSLKPKQFLKQLQTIQEQLDTEINVLPIPG